MDSFKISDIDYLLISQNTSLSFIASQLQKFSNKLLCVVNDTNLIFYSNKSTLPKNIRYINRNKDEYYFEDNENKYTVFGINEACIFYPDLSKILNIEKEDKIKIIEYVGKEKNIILYHLGKKLKFPFTNNNLIITEKSL